MEIIIKVVSIVEQYILFVMFLYHTKQPNFKGDVLYPLNQLKNIYPEVYNEARQKYSYREDLMDVDIKLADCRWNDVVHLCPVDINEIIKNLIQLFNNAGKGKYLDLERYKKIEYFKIDTSLLDAEKLFIYFKNNYCGDSKEGVQKNIDANLVKWNGNSHKIDSKLPKSQTDYFKSCVEDLNRPRYLYTAISHVFYKGSIDVSKLEVLKVNLNKID